MADFTWELQGSDPTTIGETDKVQFAGGTFDSPITVDEYNSSTHVEDTGGDDESAGNSPYNSRYLTASTVDMGSGSVALSSVSTANVPLKINFSDDVSVVTSDTIFYAYDGTTPANGPDGVSFFAAEQGDSTWTDAEGSGDAVEIEDQSTALSHDYFLLVSASPESVGEKNFALRIELTYA